MLMKNKMGKITSFRRFSTLSFGRKSRSLGGWRVCE